MSLGALWAYRVLNEKGKVVYSINTESIMGFFNQTNCAVKGKTR